MTPDEPERDAQTVSRKGEHVDIILNEDVRARVNAWDDVLLLHQAAPEVDLDAVDLHAELLNHRLAAPVMIASMTGGFPGAYDINARLAEAAAEFGLAMGVGSQRAMLKDPTQARTYEVVREHDVPFVAANIGAPQLVPQGDVKPLAIQDVHRLIDAVEADALIVHLNFLQEVVQPEGDVQAAGVLSAIEHLVKHISIPVIAKETGAGMTRRTAQRLVAAGCAALDVGGLSGTTFAAVEKVRAERSSSARHAALGETFRDWGVPTPVALAEARLAGCEVVATGGIRGGLDVARAIALGATSAGVASAVLRPASQGKRELHAFVEGMLDGLRTAMFLTGAETVQELGARAVVVTGGTRTLLEAMGHDVAHLARERGGG